MQEKASTNPKFLGIYVHVPFCAHQCSYCGFYQERPTKQSLDDYVSYLIDDIKLQGEIPPANTVYWGGGTPTILSAENILKLGTHMHISASLSEWSVECSPGTVTPQKLSILKEIGVTRMTMGIQTFNENTMQILGRRQKRKMIFEAYDLIRACGFDNIGIDMIFAIPGQTIDQWIEDLETAISLSPEHISTYNLTYEKNSKLRLPPMNEQQEIEFFITTDSFLREHGYEHYEISNFCKPGYMSVHNSHTWEMYDWIGYGPSASSQFMNKRFTNVASLKLWHDGIENNKHIRYDFYNLNEDIMIQDSLIFGLRMFKGIDFQNLKTRFKSFDKQKYQKFFEQLAAEKLAELTNKNIKLTLKGMLVADTIGYEILKI